MTNGFALNHYTSLQIYFFCVKHKAKNDFVNAVKSTVRTNPFHYLVTCLKGAGGIANCLISLIWVSHAYMSEYLR